MAYIKKILYSIWEIVEVFVIALIAVMAIKYFLVQPFIVNGASMEPNFHNGDYLLVDEISYRFHNPERGDVIVFRAPKNPSVFYIKRIIGLPGEKVEIDNGTVRIYNKKYPNGFVLKEPYIPLEPFHLNEYEVMFLKDNQFFVLGDNRLNSLDSRAWGYLPRSNIVGVVRARLWPPSALAIFKDQSYVMNN